MKLDHIPVRLGEESVLRWREEILGLYRGAQGDGTLEEEHLREDLERELGIKSVRAPLSRFLNGHGDEIRKWLCADGGEPNNKGKSLAALCGQDIDALIALLGSLLPSRASAGLEMDDLRWLDFRVMKLAKNREEIKFEQGLMLRDWLEQERDGDVPVAISSSRTSRWFYDAPAALEHELLEFQHGHRPGVTTTSRHNTNEGIAVEVSPLDRETLLSWFMKLRELGKVDDIQLERLQGAFVGEGADLFYQLDASELLALMEAIMAGNITRMSPAAMLKTLIVQRKQSATRNRSAAFQLWAATSSAFFVRWFRAHTHTGVKVNNRDLRALLELPPPGELSVDDLDDLIDAISKEGDRQQQAIQALLSRMPANNILYELKQGGVFVEDEHDPGWFILSREWANIGALELIFELAPKDLSWLDVFWNHETIPLVVRIAPPDHLGDWVDAILDDPSRITSGLEVLEGLVSRADHARSLDDARLVRLWANLLWYTLSEDISQFVHVFERASHLFEERLPEFDPESPLATLAEHADDEVIARYLDVRQLEASLANKPSGERYLCRCVPFQLPFDFIKRVYPLESHPHFDMYEDIDGVPLVDIVRRLSNKGDRGARNVLWRANHLHKHLTREELLEWIPSLAFDEFDYEHVKTLEDMLAWASGTEDRSKRAAYLSALGHVYKNLESLQIPEGFGDNVSNKFPTLWSLRMLEHLEKLEPITAEKNPSAWSLGKWLRPLIPEREKGLDLGPLRKTMEIALTLRLKEVLRHATFVHKANIEQFFSIGTGVTMRRGGTVEYYPAAQILCELHHKALQCLWLMGAREPLREFVGERDRFQITSNNLAQGRFIRRLEDSICYRAEKIPKELDDETWEALVEWLFPPKTLLDYLEEHGAAAALWHFEADEKDAWKKKLPSPVLDLEPEKRRDFLITTLARKRDTLSFVRMPEMVRSFFSDIHKLEDIDIDEVSSWRSNEKDHASLLFWARERDDAILEQWCEACLDPENHDDNWWTLKTWALEDRPRRVERIWPYIEDDHRRELLDRLNSPDDSQRISKDSPLLEHLDLFEYAGQRLHFLRKHEIEGEERARVVREVLFSARPLGYHDRWIVNGNTTEESTPAPAWLSRFWEFVNLTDVERELVSDDYTEWHADLRELSDALEVFLDADREDDATVHPGCLGWGVHIWCTDALVRQYPALLEAYIKHLVMRLCSRLSEEKFEEHWSGEVDEFVYRKVATHIQPQMKRMKLAPDSFDRERLSDRILETIENCSKRSQIPDGILSFLRENAPSIFLTDITGTWSRPEKIHEWNRTDVDEDTPLEVALKRFARRYQDPESLPVRHKDELEMLDFIEGELEKRPEPDADLGRKIDWFIVHLRYADTVERARSLMKRWS